MGALCPVRLCRRVSQKFWAFTDGYREENFTFPGRLLTGQFPYKGVIKTQKICGSWSPDCPVCLELTHKAWTNKIGHRRLSSSKPLYFFAGFVHAVTGIGETHSALHHIVGHNKASSCVSPLLAWQHLLLEGSWFVGTVPFSVSVPFAWSFLPFSF